MQRNKETFGLVLVLGALLCACEDVEVHHERAVIEERVDSIVVDVGSGDIVLRGAEVSAVTVEARIEGAANHLGQELSGGRLTLFDDCHDEPCSVSVNALVPEGVPVELRTGSGDIHTEALLAPLVLRAGSGDITGSGRFGGDLDAQTGSGDVVLDVGGEIGQVRVNTGSGDVDLDVPSGSYRLSVTTGSGDSDVRGIEAAPAATRSIEVRTGSGDVVIRGR